MKTFSSSPQETRSFGSQIAKQLNAGDVLALVGDLGAGKTNFVQGLAEGLECFSDITSPTFTLINEYESEDEMLIHADLYRISDKDQLNESGLEEILESDAIVAVEWADKFPEIFPQRTRWFYFSIDGEEGRIIEERPSQ